MFTVQMHRNDEVIGTVYCVNSSPVVNTADASDENEEHGMWCEYAYEYHQHGVVAHRGTVKHYRPNGAVALLKEICEDIEAKGGT